MPTGVSIIICCYNSSSVLPETLKHIKWQKLSGADCEVIVVDNASIDNTQQIAKSVWNNYSAIEFKIVYEAKPGLSEARRKGVGEAKYEYLIFCDDDNWLDENYVQNVYELFQLNPQVAILGGCGTAEFEDISLKPEWFDNLFHGYAVGPQASEECELNGVYGAGMALRKSIIERTLGKQPLLLHGRKQNSLSAGDDAEICIRIRMAGYKILYSPQLTFKHFLPGKRLTWEYLKKLHTGFAQMHVIINLHERALDYGYAKLPAFYWLTRAWYFWGIYIKYWPKHHRAYSKTIGTIDEIHHITWGSIGASYLKYNFKTIGIYKQIIALKTNSC